MEALTLYLAATKISKKSIKDCEQILIDNGIDKDEASIVLQAIGYRLLDVEFYK